MSFGLSRAVWVVQVGVFLSMFGYGAVLPFEIIYLHSARHFSLAAAGLVIATVTGTAIVASFPAGSLVDSIGPRDSAAAGLVLLALGYGGLAFVTSLWEAFACALVAGCGNGLVTPSQSALVAALVPRELRPRATAVSRVSVNVGFAGGASLGGIVARPGTRDSAPCSSSTLQPISSTRCCYERPYTWWPHPATRPRAAIAVSSPTGHFSRSRSLMSASSPSAGECSAGSSPSTPSASA